MNGPRPAERRPGPRATDSVVHFAPVALALFCWTVGLASYGFYEGFDDGEPATWLSLLLLATCLALLLPATWSARVEPAKRKVAGLLALVTLAALLDEAFQGHESLGKLVRSRAKFIPAGVRHYTDDVIMILAAIVGGILICRWVRSVSGKRAYAWHVFWVIVAAVGHGVLDLLGHGPGVWRVLLDEPSWKLTEYLNDVMSYFEECCKLWAEWFVILLLSAFLYGRCRGLLWSVQLFACSMLAVVGIWVVEVPWRGVPFVWVGGPLSYVRNHHLLLTLALIWIVWALIAWLRYRADEVARNTAALFFLSPFYLLVPRIAALPERSGIPPLGLLGLGLGGALAVVLLWRRWGPRALSALLPLGLLAFSPGHLAAQPRLLLAVGGLFFPLAVLFLLRERRAARPLFVAALVAAAALHDPLWLLGTWAVVLLCTIDRLAERKPALGRRVWAGLVGLQILTILGILSLGLPRFLPNDKFRPRGLAQFETGLQPVPGK